MVRWPTEPAPAEAKLSWPCRSFTWATNSRRSLAGIFSLQPRAKGFVPTIEIGAKSLSGSYAIFCTCGTTASCGAAAESSV